MALSRFGILETVVEMIQAIYSDRRFFVSDLGSKSSWKRQDFGICQGCPLSPFLFVIVMTILMQEANAALSKNPAYTAPPNFVSDLVYADDTLVIAVDETSAHAYMNSIAAAGQEYGLTFNWSKLEVMPVRTAGKIITPSGSFVKEKCSLKYLGSSVSNDGCTDTELGQRVGLAKRGFDSLQRISAHAKLTMHRKMEILNACIISKLTYGLVAISLNHVARRFPSEVLA